MSLNKRLQIDLSPELAREIEEMMTVLGVRTKKQLFEYAMDALHWILDESLAGREIAAVDSENDRYFALSMPGLRAIRGRVNASS